MTTTSPQFLLCVQTEGEPDLVVRKLYPRIQDELADRREHVRVIDESGEDYLYPSSYFVPLSLTPEAERALAESEATPKSS